jgi:hypothetical protein
VTGWAVVAAVDAVVGFALGFLLAVHDRRDRGR